MSKFRLITFIFGVLPTLLGAIVLVGWYTHNTLLIQVSPSFVPMQYNTALGFLLSGAGLLFAIAQKLKFARFSGGLVTLIGVLTLLEYSFRLDLGIDQLFMEHYVTTATSNPGRMAPNTALSFTVTGLALLAVAATKSRHLMPSMIGTLGALALGLGTIAAAGYATNLETAYGWGNLTRMAIHTAVGFLFLGAGLISYAWGRDRTSDKSLPSWLSYITAIGTLTITLSLWQALHAVQAVGISQYFILVFGLITALALGVLIHIAGNLKTIADERAVNLNSEITERNKAEGDAARAEEQNRKSGKRFRTIMESSHDGVMTFEGSGIITYWNPSAERIFGFSQDDAVGKNMVDVIVPKDFREESRAALELFAATGEWSAGGRTLEIPAINADEQEFTAEVSFSTYHQDDIWQAIAVFRDITERKADDDKIRESETQMRELLASSAIGVLININFKPVYGNIKLLEMLGFNTEEEFLRKSTAELYADPFERKKMINRMKTAGKVADHEVQIKRRDGSVFWALLSINKVNFAGQEGTVFWLTDIAELKEVEDELKLKMQETEAFNKVAVSRELKMIELKEEVNLLREEHEQTKKYNIV